MTRIVKLLIVLTCVSLLAGGISPAAAAQGDYCATDAEADMLRHINDLRQSHGLAPLELSRPLGVAADTKAVDMAGNNYMAHTSPGGTTRLELLANAGYTYDTWTGENIAAGNQGAGATFEQWLNSPPHLDIMLSDRYTAIGLGRAHNPDARYDWYWAAEFGGVVGSPASACNDDGGDQSTVEALVAVLVSILRDVLGNSVQRPAMS